MIIPKPIACKSTASIGLITAIMAVYLNFANAYAAAQDILLSSGDAFSGSVLRYDGNTGEFLGVFNMGDDVLRSPGGMTFGPDGNLYVAIMGWTPQLISVAVYDGITGELIDALPTDCVGSIAATAVAFGPDGNLYIACGVSGYVFQYDITTGRGRQVGMDGQFLYPYSLTFGPDGNLYVGYFGNGEPGRGGVERFDGTTGHLIDDCVPNLSGTWGIAFGPDGNLYVGRGVTVNKYDGKTGQLIRNSSPAELLYARSLTFGPDGYLYVVNYSYPPYYSASVLRFDPANLAFIDVLVSGAYLPIGIAFTPPQ